MNLRSPFVFALLGLSLHVACGGKAVAPSDDTGSDGGSATTGGSGGGTVPEAGSDGGSTATGGSGGGILPDAGTSACAPGFCQNAVLSSCGDSSFTPLPAMHCVTPAGQDGYCCLPTCGGFGGAPCPEGTWCDYSGGPACGAVDNTGVCRLAESACPENCPGVCGCNGSFYCNACYAHQDGQDITGDLSCQNDAGPPFLQDIQGIWLIGWSGGLRHFSWVRLRVGGPADGQADFLAGDDLESNQPYWDCTGTGQWILTAKPDTVGLSFPDGCANLGFEAITFLSFAPPTGYPAGAILTASIESTSGVPLEGYKFPPDWCNAAMSSCADPFAW